MTVDQAIYNILHAVYGEEVRESLAEGLRTMDNKSQADKEDSEAYAVGRRNGRNVSSTDPAYHNNSKYYSEIAADIISHSPMIGSNSTWLLWDGSQYIDSGISATGVRGPQGVQGPQGPQGINGVAVAAEGQYSFNVDQNGHLILSYLGDSAPDFYIDSNGHLMCNV